MKKRITPLIAAGIVALACFCQAADMDYVTNQPPLAPLKYVELPLGAVKPQGWLREQLAIMAKGSSGHLDETYWKVKNDNGWLGGKGDGWEETPYWLDGAVPLAYLAEDSELQAKVMKFISWTIENQRPSGYFGPFTPYERDTGKPVEKGAQGDDWWPKMVMLKVLQQYYMATGDGRVLPFMTRYFRYQLENLGSCPLSHQQGSEWAKSRGEDNMLVVYWLYNLTREKSLLELGGLLRKQTFDWPEWLGNRQWIMDATAQQNDRFWMRRHGVNVAMGLKTPVVGYQASLDPKDLAALKTGFTDLMQLHGLPMGIFSSDEDLHGNAPSQGAELCAVVEAMYSLEQAIAITGDHQYMDALERMAYNALPAQTSDDYQLKQYYQTANQPQIARGVHDFSLQFSETYHVFGARSGYTCCLANMHQGWPKLVEHLWYATPDRGLAAVIYGPSTVKAKVADGVVATVREETRYPFQGTVEFVLALPKSVRFPLEFRIPEWCAEAAITLNGQPLGKEKGGRMARFHREWRDGDRITLEFPMAVFTSNWGKNSRAIERGPLVYALKVGECWEKKNDTGDGDYYEVYPTTPWNYGLMRAVVDEPGKHTQCIEKPVSGLFFWNQANAPMEIQVRARRIPGWVLANGVPHQPVTDRDGLYRGPVEVQEEKVTLIPFGCTKLRIVAFPVVR